MKYNTRSTQKMAGNFNSRMINSGSPQIKRVTNIPETSERSTNEGLFSFFGYLWWAARKQLFVRLELIRSWTAKHNTYTFEGRKKKHIKKSRHFFPFVWPCSSLHGFFPEHTHRTLSHNVCLPALDKGTIVLCTHIIPLQQPKIDSTTKM